MAHRSTRARLLACSGVVLGSALGFPGIASAGPPAPQPEPPRVISTEAATTGSAAAKAASKAVAVSAGWGYSCALTTKGKVSCWGSNPYGQLGNNTTTNSSTPVGVHGLSEGVKTIAAGAYHACAVTTKGAARCWGNNNFGQLGNGTTKNSTRPTAVTRIGKVKTLSAGLYFTCALTTTSKVFCWA